MCVIVVVVSNIGLYFIPNDRKIIRFYIYYCKYLFAGFNIYHSYWFDVVLVGVAVAFVLFFSDFLNVAPVFLLFFMCGSIYMDFISINIIQTEYMHKHTTKYIYNVMHNAKTYVHSQLQTQKPIGTQCTKQNRSRRIENENDKWKEIKKKEQRQR